VVLAVGTVASLALAIGPEWAARVGVVVAVVAAVAACTALGYELRAARRAHAQEMLAASRAHGKALHEERRHNGTVVQALTVRAQAAVAAAGRQQETVTQLRVEVSTLRGDRAHLISEIRQRDIAIAGLRATVATREAELMRLGSGSEDVGAAEVHAMPRRVRVDADPAAAVPDEEGATDAETTVVDLPAVGAVVMPNYEDLRRFA
jgi:uncharacterized protein YlxW (UPF0749 family)